MRGVPDKAPVFHQQPDHRGDHRLAVLPLADPGEHARGPVALPLLGVATVEDGPRHVTVAGVDAEVVSADLGVVKALRHLLDKERNDVVGAVAGEPLDGVISRRLVLQQVEVSLGVDGRNRRREHRDGHDGHEQQPRGKSDPTRRLAVHRPKPSLGNPLR